MEFTYNYYEQLINILIYNKYSFCDYTNYEEYNKCVILRHDVDFDLEKALTLARIEHHRNIKSTYFVLLSTDFYNVFAKEQYDRLMEIHQLGHSIGLHFDERRYDITNKEELEHYVKREINLLQGLLDKKVQVVSMHRPSKWILSNDITFSNIINTYSSLFLNDFKYLSDSRMYWRENAIDVIESGLYSRLHILTHPFWYSKENIDIKDKLYSFVAKANHDRYKSLEKNFHNIREFLREDEVL